ncbi:CcdB family protein [Methylovulum psychrotolerans]|jgi:toxin CcdB|uniref:CcdB family protein n=1 Tax=Methylovulum psychrotolerans TaxID=1704499 RepID=UPI001BFF9749|nr:CcdB family protein [Methylovulum psychrotolerans]MBT9098587.1 CcdB family protein [Methylovulum psychrotolerans]
MAQFDVYENKNPKTKRLMPFLLDAQNDLLSGLATTLIIPLCLATEAKPLAMARLTPLLMINGEDYLLLTPQLAGISKQGLGNAVANLAAYRDDIIGALDFLVTGV